MQKNSIADKRYAWAEINLSSLSHNLEVIRSHMISKGTRIMAVVKADAYGHGAVEISRHALKSGAYALGVALVEEGVELRRSGIMAPVYVLGESPPEAVKDAVDYNLIPAVNSYKTAQLISEWCGRTGRNLDININIDTGMNRIGLNYKDALHEIQKIAELKNLKINAISTHFACAGCREDSYTGLQWRRFNEAIDSMKGCKMPVKFYHCANSPAFFRYREMHMDMVRTGVSIYGLNPYDSDYMEWLPEDTINAVSDLKPVLSLKTRISFIKKVPADCRISYCGTFKTGRESIIATVPIGYADGYSRLLSNRAKVLLGTEFAPVVGNITMDQFMIDVTDIARKRDIDIGSEAILIGSNSRGQKITAEEIGELMGTINYEVVCMLKNRIPRIYIE